MGPGAEAPGFTSHQAPHAIAACGVFLCVGRVLRPGVSVGPEGPTYTFYWRVASSMMIERVARPTTAPFHNTIARTR